MASAAQVIAPAPVPAGNDAVQASLAGFSPKSESSEQGDQALADVR